MQNIYWDLLKKNQEEFKKRRIENLFKADNNRLPRYNEVSGAATNKETGVIRVI